MRIKYLTRLRLEFSHLRWHKFKHGFLGAIDSLCSCSSAIEMLFFTSFTVPTFQLSKVPFSMKLQLLTDLLLIKMKSKLFKLSFMVI